MHQRSALREMWVLGSRSHCLSGELAITLRISSGDAGVKQVRMAGSDGDSMCGLEFDVLPRREECNFKILSEKKVAKELPNDVEDCEVGSLGV